MYGERRTCKKKSQVQAEFLIFSRQAEGGVKRSSFITHAFMSISDKRQVEPFSRKGHFKSRGSCGKPWLFDGSFTALHAGVLLSPFPRRPPGVPLPAPAPWPTSPSLGKSRKTFRLTYIQMKYIIKIPDLVVGKDFFRMQSAIVFPGSLFWLK